MDQLIHEFATFLRHHMTSISIGLVATFLMLVGGYINGFFKKITRSMPFVARFALFIALCSAGYALLSSLIFKLLKWVLLNQGDLLLIGLVSACYVGLAILAYRGRDV